MIKEENRRNITMVSLWSTLFTLIFSLILVWIYFVQGNIGLLENQNVVKTFIVKYDFLIDNFSIVFIPVVNFICFITALWLWKKESLVGIKKFFVSLLIFQSFSISAVLASDLVLLFIFMESSIIPLYIMLNSFEKSRSLDSILNFIVYSIISALLILISFIMLYYDTGSSSLEEIYEIGSRNPLIFWLLLIGIAVKIPVWPLYYWLPIVHVKSSTGCSVVLSSIVLKFSSLLIVRLIIPIFSDFLAEYSDILYYFFASSILFAIAQAIFQDNLKKIFAYFSVVHMNMSCIILLKNPSIMNFVFSIISHSIVIAYLFFVADFINRIFKTKQVSELKNIQAFPIEMKLLFFIGVLSLIGVPGFCSFISEMLCFYSLADISEFRFFSLCLMLLCSAGFLFYLYCNIFCHNKNKIKNEINLPSFSKKISIYCCLFFIFLLGIFPNLIFSIFRR